MDLILTRWRQSLYMGKQLDQTGSNTRRTSTRPIKKKYRDDEEEDEREQPNLDKAEAGSDSQYGDSESNSNEDDEESSEESSSELAPENMAVRNMQFREKRGTKMTYLINRKKMEEEDPFWAMQGQNYFGNLDQGDEEEEEDYVQSSSGRDEFDSDFNQTESEHQIEEGAEEKEVDEDQEKKQKKRLELMRKIHAPTRKAAAQKTATQKTAVSSSAKKKVESDKKIVVPEPATRYIHEAFNQEQLLGEAATTQYFNWLSLKKLVQFETEKKDFMSREHHIEGPKVTYRNRMRADGHQDISYELQDVEVKEISDLTKFLSSK